MAETPRRNRILEAGLREFSERGLSGARTAAIAEFAGVNKQLIFYYFGSKDGLYASVLSDYLLGPIAEPATSESVGAPVERLRAILSAFLDNLGGRPEVTPLLLRALAESGDGRDAVLTALGDLEDSLAAIVTGGQGHGYVRDDADPRVAAAQIVSLMLGYLVRVGAGTRRGPSREGRARWTDEVSDLVTRALRW